MSRGRLPPSYFGAAMALMAVLQFLDPVIQLLHSPWRYAGLVPIVVGGWLDVVGSRLFDRAGTTIKPFEDASVLVAGGPFRYGRNPMYLGMVADYCARVRRWL